MNYLVYVLTNEAYDEQFSKKNSEKADQIREKIHNFVMAPPQPYKYLFWLVFKGLC